MNCFLCLLVLSLHNPVDMHAHVRCHPHVSSAVTTQLTPQETHMEHFLFLQTADPPAHSCSCSCCCSGLLPVISCPHSIQFDQLTALHWMEESMGKIQNQSILIPLLQPNFYVFKNRKSHFHPFSFISFKIKWITNLLLGISFHKNSPKWKFWPWQYMQCMIFSLYIQHTISVATA